MAGKGGRQRERERRTGEPSTQARSTWPTHIAPTRFLSLADNCTISLHSLVLSSLPSPLSPFSARVRSLLHELPPAFRVLTFSYLPSSSNSLILPPRRLFHFHAVSCRYPASCTLFPLVYIYVASCSILRTYLSFASSFSRALLHTLAPVILARFPSLFLSYTFVSPVVLRLACSWLPPPWIHADALCPGSSSLLRPFLSHARARSTLLRTRTDKASYSLHRGLRFSLPFIPASAHCPRSPHYART